MADHAHHIPAVVQKECVPSVGTIERHGVEVKIERESSPQPVAVFLPCSFSEVIDSHFKPCVEEFKEEISYDSTGSAEAVDFRDYIETKNELEPPGEKLMRKYKKKIKLCVRCEYCDKGNNIFDHCFKFLSNPVNFFRVTINVCNQYS